MKYANFLLAKYNLIFLSFEFGIKCDLDIVGFSRLCKAEAQELCS